MSLALHPWQNQTCLFSYIPYSTRLEALGWGGDRFGSGATRSYFAKLPLRPVFFIAVIVDILGACHQILYVLH